MQGRTRVLITHHVPMCLPYADFMVMMNKGRIVLKGAPQDLKAQGVLTSALKELEDEYTEERLRKIAEQKNLDPNIDLTVLQGILVKEEEREEGRVKFEVWKTFIDICGGNTYWATVVAAMVVAEAMGVV
ncbi:hypothetical protein GGI11_003824 [Coemansia sp. RSA 2049]|nr:hypothetical protein GGI11_003824 [Coemansia sp. RSA 2049]